MERFFDLVEIAFFTLMRQKARSIVAVAAVSLAVLGMILISGHALSRRDAIIRLTRMMFDMTLAEVLAPSPSDDHARPLRRHLILEDVAALSALDSVTSAVPLYSFAAEAKIGRDLFDVNVIGSPFQEYLATCNYKLVNGRMPNPDASTPEALLTRTAAGSLFYLEEKDIIGQKPRLNGHRIHIVGIIDCDVDLYHKDAFLVTPDQAQTIGRLDNPTSIAIRLADAKTALRLRQKVERLLSRRFGRGLGPDMVRAGYDNVKTDLDQLGKDLLAQAVFLTLGFFIAIATVAELLYADIQASVAEISTRRALGAHKLDIVLQITFQGLFICLLGGLIGLALAQSYYFWPEDLQKQFRWASSPQIGFLAVLLSFAAGLVASLLPALNAVSLPPVTAMREAAK